MRCVKRCDDSTRYPVKALHALAHYRNMILGNTRLASVRVMVYVNSETIHLSLPFSILNLGTIETS